MISDLEKLSHIRACDVWAPLGESGAAVLAERMNEERHGAGETIIAEGAEADRVYTVIAGSVTVHLEGAVTPLRTVGVGEILGDFCLFAPWLRTATIKAETDCILLSVTYPRFRDFLHEFPEVMYHLLETVVWRLTDREKEIFGDAKGP